jgi:3-oxoacyl-(acyl-carrier-protein) synthase/malonyl CoA-acyl carrier protein transacylase/NAD(P)-dependent dehydrogenase (short-subunit alcohol dehydrogenase family)/phosphopantetheinyl transferase (holo-ACP synthase)/acyl carrier protein
MQEAMILQAEEVFKQGMPGLSEDTCAGVFGSIFASRINNCFDFGGTSMVVDAACASSLAAVDLAIKGLRDRQFDLVLAGGVDGCLNISSYIFFSSLGAISAKGSFPFDERADGFVLGEGAGMILLKRMEDAVRDGDKIHALIRGVGTSSDGRAKGITTPDIKGQVRALERAYKKVSFSPNTISLVEAHGTATWIGDEVELASLNKFFNKHSARKQSIGVGSVKSMIGHLKSASGMAGIIKVSQALRHKILPPTINCQQPRKDFDWKNSPFYLIDKARPWDSGSSVRRAAVDSFGFGGINYHAILEEAPSKEYFNLGMIKHEKRAAALPADIFIFSAPTRKKLIERIAKTQSQLAQSHFAGVQDIDDKSFKASNGPILTIVAVNKEELIRLLDKAAVLLSDESRSEFFMMQGIYFSEKPLMPKEKIAFLFPGSGAQYLNMGVDLPVYFPFIKDVFNKIDEVSRKHTGASILSVLVAEQNDLKENRFALEKRLIRSDYNHPAMMAIEVAILQTLIRAGLKPDMVAGHSLGEYFALYAAGVFDLDAVIDLITIRGEGIVKYCFENGAMASIGLGAEDLHDVLRQTPGVVAIANKNCPAQTVISGEVKAVKHVVDSLEKQDIFCRQLPVISAYHTSLLDPCVKPFRKFLKTFKINLPKIPVQCNLTGQFYKVDHEFTAKLPEILATHMVRPVEFINNILSMYEDGARLFIEVGPRSTLSSFVDNILGDKPHWTAQTNMPNRSPAVGLLHCLALCIAKGVEIDLSGIMSYGGMRACCEADDETDNLSEIDKPKDYSYPVDPELTNLVVNLIALKTGYPEEVIDIDLDVEAELGLDSIKQVTIIRTVAKTLNIDFGTDMHSQRYKITTPRKLIHTCASLLAAKVDVEPGEEEIYKKALFDHKEDKWGTDCYRWVSEKVATPLRTALNKDKLAGKHVLLLGSNKKFTWVLKKYLVAAQAKVSVRMVDEIKKEPPFDFDLVLNSSSYKENDLEVFEKSDQWWQKVKDRACGILMIAKNLARLLRNNNNKQAVWIEMTSLGGELNGAQTSISSRAGLGLGLMRCLVQEFAPKLRTLIVDFDPKQSDKYVAQAICNELKHETGHAEIGYIAEKRFEIRWSRKSADKKQGKLKLNEKSVVLAIGGARGITASICLEIAKKNHMNIIVVGKSKVPLKNHDQIEEPIDFEQARLALLEDFRKQKRRIVPTQINKLAWDQVWQSERLWNMKCLNKSANVVYRQCDITNASSVDLLIKEVKKKYSKLDLVINGASGLIEKSTEDITCEEFIDNMKVKALGTACLINALVKIPVDAFINFSSVAGRWGNKGQSSYAAGHEVAAILVSAMRRQNAGRWINVFFGPWLNVGMIRMGDVVDRLKQKGSDFITNETGKAFFMQELLGTSNCNVAFCGKKSIRTQINRQEEICGLFLDNTHYQKMANLLGYKKDLFISQVSIKGLKEAPKHKEKDIIEKYLSNQESKRYYGFKHAKKRLEWLAGRLAAKEAAHRYFKNDGIEKSAIRICNLPDGCPQIVIKKLDAKADIPHLSISHNRGIAVALVGGDAGIAIDIQEINPSIVDISDAFSSNSESQMLLDATAFALAEALTVGWAVKEASRKAVGVDKCTMKEALIKEVKVLEDCIICKVHNDNIGWVKSIAVKCNNYINAISAVGAEEGKGGRS